MTKKPERKKKGRGTRTQKKMKKRKEQKKRTKEQKNKRTKAERKTKNERTDLQFKKFLFDWLGMNVIHISDTDGLSRDERAIHSNRLTSDRSCSYEGLYDRARKCGASHAQAVLYADKIICARSKSFEAD